MAHQKIQHKDVRNNRIVITGIGVVSSIGIGKEDFWQALKQGKSGIKPVTLFDTSSMQSKLAGEIADFKAEEILGEKGLRNLDRATKLALCASELALHDSELKITEQNTDHIGVVLGSTMGSVRSISEFDKEGIMNGPRSVNPALFSNTVINSPASQISIRLQIKGLSATISSGFSSALDAVKYAIDCINSNKSSAVLVGGAEELCEQTFKGFYKLKLLSASRKNDKEMICPFDVRRNGMILGEGAAFFLIEKLSSAINRKAPIYAEIIGYGTGFDYKSVNRYRFDSCGPDKSIKSAITSAKINFSDVSFVASSANSDVKGDAMEANAVKKFFGVKKIAVPAIKSMIGETFSASGAMQLAAAVLMMKNQFLAPTINYDYADEQCPIDCVPNEGRPLKINYSLVNAFGLTGQHSSLVLSGGRI